jgi:hypothetical protein
MWTNSLCWLLLMQLLVVHMWWVRAHVCCSWCGGCLDVCQSAQHVTVSRHSMRHVGRHST